MKRIVNLKTYYKLLMLIISTSVFFFLLYASLYLYTVHEEKEFYKTTYNQYNSEVKSLFELNSKTHAATIIDVTFWDELVKFTKTKDDIWYKKFVESHPKSIGITAFECGHGIWFDNPSLVISTIAKSYLYVFV